MAFGFFNKGKNKGPHEVTCPLCQHSQPESPLAVSSYCKGCKAYLSFSKGGEVTARAQSAPDPFAHRPAQPKVEIDYTAREEATPATRVPKTPRDPQAEAAETIQEVKKEPDAPKVKLETSAEPVAEQKAAPAPQATPVPAPTPKWEPSPAPQRKTAPKPAIEKVPEQAPAANTARPSTAPPAPAPDLKAAPSFKSPAVPAPPEATPTAAQEPTEEEDLPEIVPLLGAIEAQEKEDRENESDDDGTSPRYHRQISEDEVPSGRALKKKSANERVVACFECGDEHLANSRANSTQCRKCGRLISLTDQHIKEHWSSRIQTRGNVYIHKKGVVSGGSIQCHDLVVEGDFTGNAECSGDLTLRRHGKIVGDVSCHRLLIEKRAKVEFLNLVEMNECKIDGNVTGNLSCRGLLALEKKATLTGDIRVGRLTVADGAKHSGQIQMGAF